MERLEQHVELGALLGDARAPVDAHPPEQRPVLLEMVDEETHRGVGSHVVEALELRGRLRLLVDRGDELVEGRGEAHRHQVGLTVGGDGGEPPDARLRDPAPHHVELHEEDGTVRSVGCAGLLLTGGSSLRLGTDKATLVARGERLVDRLSRLLGEVCDPVLEIGPGYGECPSVRETPPGGGPLAALAAGASALAGRRYEGAALVLAVDLPGIDAAVLAWLAQHPAPATVVPIVDGMPQTLCARYGRDALGAVPALLASGERSLRALLAAVPVHEAHVDEWGRVASAAAFADVDTPEDAARAGIEWPG